MRYHLSFFVVFSIGALVLAAPTDKKMPINKKPINTVNKDDVKLGAIYWSRLKFVEPKDPGYKYKDAIYSHPVVVVSDVDAHDKVKVALVSHHLPHSGSAAPVSNYADLEGSIDVGPPKTVSIKHLVPPKSVKAVRPGRLQPLIDHINSNCPADQKLTGCEPSGSAQGNTVHGSPEHDHSKQSSQQSSSNKGSSSQVSRPGSPEQSSQKSSSSQGSQLGGSEQGIPPGSSKQGSQADSSKLGSGPGSPDDGWQVVTNTGRRKNKASKSSNK